MRRVKDLLSAGWRAAPAALCVAAGVGILVRFTVHDRLPVIAGVAYTLRPAAGALLLALAGLLWFIRGSGRAAALSGASAFFAASIWATGALFLNPPPADPPANRLRGMAWNVWHGYGGWDRVAEGIREVDPDIAWIVEGDAGEDAPPDAAEPDWGAMAGGRSWRASHGLVLMVKGEILDATWLDLTRGSHAMRARVRTRLGVVDGAVVDLHGRVFRHRGPAVERLEALARDFAEGPSILAGDFNTPRDSALWSGLRADWTHAFEAVGRGFDGTWPMVGPVLPIDHVWGRGVRFTSCDHRRGWASDHSAVVVEFGVP